MTPEPPKSNKTVDQAMLSHLPDVHHDNGLQDGSAILQMPMFEVSL